MICRPCADAADRGHRDHPGCVDGGRIDGDGRWCDCQHGQMAVPPWTRVLAAAQPGQAAAN